MGKKTSVGHITTAETFGGDEGEFRKWLVTALRAQATRVATAIQHDSLADGVMLDAAHFIESLPPVSANREDSEPAPRPDCGARDPQIAGGNPCIRNPHPVSEPHVSAYGGRSYEWMPGGR